MAKSTAQQIFASAMAALLAAAPLSSQVNLPISPVRPQGLPFLRSYKGVTVPELRTSRSLRLHALIRSGVIYLTVHDALEVAIENNLDLESARYDIARAEWDVQRAQSGGPLRGVTSTGSTGIRLGSGQGVAGSQANAGGGGGGGIASVSGAALIQQIGPVTPQLDPIFTALSIAGHYTSPQDQVVQSASNYFSYQARSYSEQVSQGLLTGGNIRYYYSDSFLNEGVPVDVLNSTSFINTGFSFNHNLLQGRGSLVNDRFIRLSQRRGTIIDNQFRLRLATLVTNVLNTYWDLSVAADNLRYTTRNRELADEFLRNVRMQIAAGAIPSIDQVRVQSNLATQEQAWNVAQNNVLQRESAMKDVLSWHGGQDPELEAAHIITVDPLVVPEVEHLPEFSSLMETARVNRRDLMIARQQEEMAGITAYGTANGVLPSLRVFLRMFNVGQAGAPGPGQTPTAAFVGGAGTALAQVFHRDFPNENGGILLNAQLHNTLAQADSALDELSQRQAQLARAKAATDLARDIALQRLTLLQASTRYHSAIESRKIIEQLLQGEEQKWKAGTSTVSAIVQARRDLANAQSTELAAAEAFVRAQVSLDQALGVTLQRNNIDVEDALRSVPDGK